MALPFVLDEGLQTAVSEQVAFPQAFSQSSVSLGLMVPICKMETIVLDFLAVSGTDEASTVLLGAK